ncbi:aspartate/tyrosine/aromatic aminotransferase [Rhizorhabdus wittichii]|uniref:Aminotransferase n=1 Tax=Rhizorhabdus wittichii TaxID=160791 RepID=A0A975HFZ4_9SPHN|nr:amino acid aminotransferase [Rhizorhabdus wittichii]QTH23940.1 aspartate/tyrosine/aromatic aminotransferase [Rhizorhabdus wittichii]
MTQSPISFFATLQPQPADPLLSLIKLFREDGRAGKIDLGVGVYRNDKGETPVFRAVKAAERKLVETQATKAYLGADGNVAYLDRLRALLFAQPAPSDLVGLQTPGGTGAIRLGMEIANAARPRTRIWISDPSWPAHIPLARIAGLEPATFRYLDPATGLVAFDEVMDLLRNRAEPGDVILLQGCCHNPTGADLTPAQWTEAAAAMRERGLIPFVDFAYHGLGTGIEEDLAGVRIIADLPQYFLAYSCSKNFGLYRERVGALFVRTGSTGSNLAVMSNLALRSRLLWSMPPDHGAAIVEAILSDAGLTGQWQAELAEMRARIRGVRALFGKVPGLAVLAGQQGMFAQLALQPEQVQTLRTEQAIYMAESGRINLAGISLEEAARFIAALGDGQAATS